MMFWVWFVGIGFIVEMIERWYACGGAVVSPDPRGVSRFGEDYERSTQPQPALGQKLGHAPKDTLYSIASEVLITYALRI